MHREIVNEVSFARFFSLRVDETKDSCKTEQVSFCLRYVLNNEPHEEFLNFKPADELNAPSLFHDIVETLPNEGVDIQQCVAQSYE